MVKFNDIAQIEKEYEFIKAVATADTFNGAFGTVEGTNFTAGAQALKAIMNVECGDNAGLDFYPIAKGEDLRVVDLAQFDGETIEIYGDELPAEVAVGNQLESDASGKLIVGSGAADHLVVKEVFANTHGVKAVIAVHKA